MEHRKEPGLQLCRGTPGAAERRNGILLREGLTLLLWAAIQQMVWRGMGARSIPGSALLAVMLLMAVHLILIARKKDTYFYPSALGVLLLVALAAGKWSVEGMCLIWNQISSTYTSSTANLLPLLKVEMQESGQEACLQLAAALLSVGTYLLCRLLTGKCRMGSAVLVPLAGLFILICFRQTSLPGWFLLNLLTALLLLLSSGWKRDALWPLAVGTGVCLVLTGILCGGCAAPPVQHWAERVQQTTQHTLHHLQYETGQTALPEGNFEKYDPEQAVGYTAMTVTMEKPEAMYLRGFTADRFDGERWLPLEASALAADRDMLYWLYEQSFYPQAQYAAAAAGVETEHNHMTVEVMNGCSKYAYIPYSLVGNSLRPYLHRDSLQSGMALAEGDKRYGYDIVYGADTLLEQVMAQLQNTRQEQVTSYRRAESSYRDFVMRTELQIPAMVLKQMGPAMDACCSLYGSADQLTLAQAQSSALLFLSHYFGEGAGEVRMPLESLAGSQYQYATVAAMVLRYYGVPARYAEGYVITPEMAREAQGGVPISVENSCGKAWVEVYQQGLGWLPLELTPGFEALAGKETEAGFQPVGVEGVDPEGEIGSEAGEGEGLYLTEGKEEQNQDAEQNDTDDSLSTGGTMVMIRTVFRWSLLLLPLLLVVLLALVIVRKFRMDSKRKQRFQAPDGRDAVGWIFADTAQLLEELNLKRGTGSMEPVCRAAGEKFGETFGNSCLEMMKLNERCLFSSHQPEEPQRSAMEAYYKQVVDLVHKNIKWYRRIWLKWVLCRY